MYRAIVMPIMLLRNLNVCKGLSNRTRMIITSFSERVLFDKIMTGRFKDKEVLFCRVLWHCDGDVQAKASFYQFQFPVVPCFLIMFNKSKGQILGQVPVLLPLYLPMGSFVLLCLV